MKNTILITILLICVISAPSKAQLIKNYGIKLAITSTHQSWEYANPSWNYEPEKRRVGFNLGLYAEWLNTPIFSILTQLEYTQRGFGEEFQRRDDSNRDLGRVIYYTRFDYLSVPILLKAKIHGEGLIPYAIAGPRLDYFLGYKSETQSTVWENNNKFIFGLSLGAGIEIKNLLPIPLITELRYNFDLTNASEEHYIMDVVSPPAPQTRKIKNNAFDFWIGIPLN